MFVRLLLCFVCWLVCCVAVSLVGSYLCFVASLRCCCVVACVFARLLADSRRLCLSVSGLLFFDRCLCLSRSVLSARSFPCSFVRSFVRCYVHPLTQPPSHSPFASYVIEFLRGRFVQRVWHFCVCGSLHFVFLCISSCKRGVKNHVPAQFGPRLALSV